MTHVLVKTAAAPLSLDAGLDSLLPTHDPNGTHARAFVAGLYGALRKEAGLDEAQACGFLQALAELGEGQLGKRAGLWDTTKQIGNVGYNVVRHPIVSAQAVGIANQSDQTRAITGDIANGNTMSALGGVAHLGWNKLKENLPGWMNQGVDWAKSHLSPENLGHYAPQIVSGLGTFAAGKLLGMGNLSAAALGAAGGYGLPKMYEGLSHLAPAAPHVDTLPNPGLAPAHVTLDNAGQGPLSEAQGRLSLSSGSADQLAQRATRPDLNAPTGLHL